MNLSDYEKLFGEHGHKYMYYPKEIIQEKLRKELIEELSREFPENKKEIKKTINMYFRGYD